MSKKQYLVIILALILLAGVVAYWYARRDEIKVVNNLAEEQAQGEAEQSNESVVTSGDEPQPGSQVHDLPVSPAVAAARAHLAERLSVGTKNILVLSAFEKDWPNSCLGLEEAGEFCAQVIVPGFEVTMRAQGEVYIYRTTSDGSAVKAEN